MREAQKCIYAEKLTQLPRPRFFPTHFCTFIALLHLIVNNRNNSSKKGTFLYTDMKYPISRFNLRLRNQLSIQFDLATIPDLIMFVSEAKHVSLFSPWTN